MDFNPFWRSLSSEEKASLARAANTSVAYLSQIAHGHRKAGADVIERLMCADQRISFEMLRGRADPAGLARDTA